MGLRIHLVIGFFCIWSTLGLLTNRKQQIMAHQLICSACGHVGSSKTAIKGSMGVEILLFIFFIIPGVIYSIWRSSSRYRTCSSCGSTNLIPLNSPVGKKLLADQGKTPETIQAEISSNKKPIFKKIFKWLAILAVVFVVLVIIIIVSFM